MKKYGDAIWGVVGGLCIGTVWGAKWAGNQYDSHCEKIEKNADKFSDYYNLTLQWIKNQQQGKYLTDYFKKNGYRKIAIYGMNDIAYLIMSELKGTETEVAFCIDRNADNLFLEIKSYKPDDKLPNVDICVIALPDLCKEITKRIKPNLSCPIVSIEDIVWEI